jgi:hypothetical protein
MIHGQARQGCIFHPVLFSPPQPFVGVIRTEGILLHPRHPHHRPGFDVDFGLGPPARGARGARSVARGRKDRKGCVGLLRLVCRFALHPVNHTAGHPWRVTASIRPAIILSHVRANGRMTCQEGRLTWAEARVARQSASASYGGGKNIPRRTGACGQGRSAAITISSGRTTGEEASAGLQPRSPGSPPRVARQTVR